MDWLEQELKQALERKEPRADFDARVNDKLRRRPVLAMPRWLAAAAVLAVMTSAGAGYRWHQGQVAKDQVMLAMRIAGGKLNRVQARVQAQPAGVKQ